MDCIFCGEWFVSSGDSTICPPCEKAMKRLGIKMSPDRLRQLVQAEKDGRCMMLPNGHYGGKDGEEALKHVMHVVGITNNAINRYIADAVAEKLVREEAEKALEENRCGE